MKTLNLTYKEPGDIVPFIRKHDIASHSEVLVHMYAGSTDKDELSGIIQLIRGNLPQAQVVGATTDGEISGGVISTNEIIISFMLFDKTQVHTSLYPFEEFESLDNIGHQIVQEMITEKTKLILLLANGLHFDYDKLAQGLGRHSSHTETKIFGALAGANGEFGETYVWLDDQITINGIVAIALDSEVLEVYPLSNHCWKEIGTSFLMTCAEGNIIRSINKLTPLMILKKYLGEQFVKELPLSGTQFPMMTVRNGKKTPLFVTHVLEDGSIKVDRRVYEGESFTFSYTDAQGIIDKTKLQIEELINKPVESILIFNCMARRRYFGHFVEKEIKALQGIAPTTGFFSYGEIDYSSKGQVDYVSFSNITIAMSESTVIKSRSPLMVDFEMPNETKAVLALSHLVDASTRDIAKLNKSIEKSEQRYKSLFEHNSDIVFSIDLFGRVLSVNPRFSEIFGFTEKQILKKSALSFLKPSDVERVSNHFFQALQGIEQTYEVDLKERDGQERTYLIKHIPIIVHGERAGVYGIGRDITAQKKAEERVAYLAYFDAATALPNRQNFSERLSEKMDEIKKAKSKQKLAVLFIDFDRFKLINDSLGHYVGDKLLIHIIERIRKILPSKSYLGRFGGDKFTLYLSDYKSVDEVINIAQALLNSIYKPILYNEQEFYVTASIGVSLFPNDGVNAESLLKNADAAMNQAKKLGGNRVKFYSNDMNHQAMFRIELESYLRKALEKNEFFLCYQPFIDIQSKRVIGAEALIRWDHPKLGLVSPAEFIPLAEETGLITDIGVWVLRSACLEAKRWHEIGIGDMTISVNVSAHQFQQPTFIQEVKKALMASGLEPSYLQLELTESVMLRNATYSIAVMKELQELGVQLSVDDFGTGYSSLSYLRDLPINNLKIDRSFIKNLRYDSKDVAIVHAIVTMGKGLNLKVIAEGIESEEQLQLLETLSCDVAQGYHLSKPREQGEFEKFIKERLMSFI
ncbi:EAL domain-containing protein [Bacillus tianshenii]|uniref:bifunctional diguanylate cyclase/phosphodiesterase n=1 Tax=Sutcliffiella tianshenii TaxID=1463404 RepID=UPI001CD35A1E|nr:EAL domain-containing protein [Bacillus tianshenii]MCA1320135.1 EAL domain-containing protein [Bacillus tianshenii]